MEFVKNWIWTHISAQDGPEDWKARFDRFRTSGLDAVLPMIYHYYYGQPSDWIGQAAREGVEALAGRLPLYAGLFIPQLEPEVLGPVVADVRAAGVAGVSMFSSGAMTEGHWDALGLALMAG